MNQKNHEKELEILLKQEKETRNAMLSMLEDLQEQKEQIESAHKEWVDAFDVITDAVMLHDKENRLMRVNHAYKVLSGALKFKHIIGKPYFQVFPKLDKPMKTCEESVQTHSVAEEELFHEDGRVFRSRTYPIYDEYGDYSYGIHLFEDITQARKQEEQIIELNKTLRLISRCNEILVRSVKEKALASDICDEIIASEEYDFAGIYFCHENAIRCDYYATTSEGTFVLKNANLEEEQYKKCPVTVCIKEAKVISINDIATDSEWSDILAQHREICPALPFNMQGSMLTLPLRNDKVLGALVVYSREVNQFDTQKNDLFTELSDDTAYGVHTLRLRKELEKVSHERLNALKHLKKSLTGTIGSVAMMVEARDLYTAGHQKRVAELAAVMAKKMGLDDNRVEGIRLAGIVHDIGKIQIPSEILTKPTQLTEIEYEMMKTHPKTGYEILRDIDFPWPIAQIIYQHHERCDGSGYPNGLKKDEILLEAKILCVADVVEAMASHRPYRPALGIEAALEEIQNHRSIRYDEQCVDTCIALFHDGEYAFI